MAIIRQIGIDFGTSTTVLRFKDYKNGKDINPNQPPEQLVHESKPTIASIVFETKSGELLFGEEAEHYSGEGTMYTNFKMDLMSNDKKVYDKTLSLILSFIKYLRGIYVEQLPTFGKYDDECTYISYPAKWSEDTRNEMIRLTVEAGFKNVNGMDEPTAAINSLLYQYSDKLVGNRLLRHKQPCNILLVDMGAGTTDLVYCEYIPGVKNSNSVILSWPSKDSGDYFGGREIDDCLTNYCIEYLKKFGVDYNQRRSILDRNIKRWKEGELSKALNKGKRLPGKPSFINMIINSFEDHDFQISDRASFEDTMNELLETFPRIIHGCKNEVERVNNSNIFADTDIVILTGGNSQWYFIREFLFGQRQSKIGEIDFTKLKLDSDRLLNMARPQEAVAFGLTLNEKTIDGINRKIISYKEDKTSNPNYSEIDKIDDVQSENSENKLIYKKLKDLQPIVNIVNEVSLAIGDESRGLNDSSIADVIKVAAKGVSAIGTTASLAAIFSLGTTGLSIAGITSAATVAGGLVGGAAIAGAFVLAAPVAILGVGGGVIASLAKKKANKQLIVEKEILLIEINKNNDLLKNLIISEDEAVEERKIYLNGLYALSQQAEICLINDLEINK